MVLEDHQSMQVAHLEELGEVVSSNLLDLLLSSLLKPLLRVVTSMAKMIT